MSVIAVAGARAVGEKSPQGTGRAPAPNAISLDQVNQALRLIDSQIVELDVDPTPERPQNVAIAIDGQAYTLALAPHSVRAAGYRLVAQIEDGSYVDVDPGPERMLRGTVLEIPGSRVAGGLLEDGLHLVVSTPDWRGGIERRWIEPLAGRVPGAGPTHYAVYRSEDVIPSGGACGVDNDFLAAHPPPIVEGDFRGDGGPEGAVYCAELAADADREYYVFYGSNVVNVQNRINLVINTMNNQYINQVQIQHMITQIIVRTAEPDPYTSTSPNSMLGEFQNHWNANHGNVPRDVAHLFTGKNLDGSVIGIAYLGVICNTGSAYGLVQSDCCNPNLACATDLSAHEIGHNWNASHCTASCSSTMNAGLTCVNTFANSSPSSVTQIVSFRNTRTCLASTCAVATLPFTDQFPSTTFDSGKWSTVVGAVIDTVGLAEPSAPNSMRLRGSATGGNEARTARIDTSGVASLQLEYYYQRRGGGDQPEAGDDLVVEFFSNVGTWVEVSRQLGSGPAMTTYAPVTVTLPPSAFHDDFLARFRAISFQTNLDDWFVDNVSITGIYPPSNDNCQNSILKGAGSHAFSTIGATTDGPDEPGGCNFNGFTHIQNDIWFTYFAQCAGTATISLCGANYNAKLAVYGGGCPSGSGSTLACSDDFCGTAPQVSFSVNANTAYRVRIGGVNNATGAGTMVITCTPTPQCPADTNSDGMVNVSDLLAVINAWGPCAGCAADINGDGQVNVSDLLAVINAWGPCP